MIVVCSSDARAGGLVERILAVVEGRPVLLSEVRLMERVSGRDRAGALEALIDERLMFREAARLSQAAVAQEEEDRAYRSLLERVGTAPGLPEQDLRQLARRQTAIVKYVEFRFRPQVRADEEAVRRAYEEERAAGSETRTLAEAAPALRARLAERDLAQRIEAWVKELRVGAEVRYNAEVTGGASASP